MRDSGTGLGGCHAKTMLARVPTAIASWQGLAHVGCMRSHANSKASTCKTAPHCFLLRVLCLARVAGIQSKVIQRYKVTRHAGLVMIMGQSFGSFASFWHGAKTCQRADCNMKLTSMQDQACVCQDAVHLFTDVMRDHGILSCGVACWVLHCEFGKQSLTLEHSRQH